MHIVCVYIYIYITKGCVCCSIADQKGFQNSALRKKNHEHGTNQSTHPSFIETCNFEEINH